MKTKGIIFYLVILIMPILAAYIYRVATYQNISNDLAAYASIIQANDEANVETATKYATTARSFAVDPKLYQFADKLYDTLDTMGKMGMANASELGTFSGIEKELEYGLTHPEFLPKSVYESIRTWDVKDEIAEIDRIYAPQLQAYRDEESRRNTVSKYIIWLGLLVGAGFLVVGSVKSGKKFAT